MVLRHFRKIAKSVAKRAVEEVAKRAAEELAKRSADDREAGTTSDVHEPAANHTSNREAELARPEPPERKASPKQASRRKRLTKKRERKAAEQAPEHEPLPTRTMARLLMKQARWARALLIYDQLQQEKSPSGAVPDLSLAAERMTAYHQLALEAETPITWRHLRKRGEHLYLHDPGIREDDGIAERPLHLAVLRFDRRSLVEWEVQRDDRVAMGRDFSFEPVHRGDYAIAAVERDGALRWVTPMCEWDETEAPPDR